MSYFLLYVGTILVVRVWLWQFPKHGPMFFGFRPHHYVYGLVVMLLYLLFAWPVLLAVGAALVVDEVPLFFIFKGFNWPDNHWKEYQSWQSIAGVVLISVIGFVVLLYMGAV